MANNMKARWLAEFQLLESLPVGSKKYNAQAKYIEEVVYPQIFFYAEGCQDGKAQSEAGATGVNVATTKAHFPYLVKLGSIQVAILLQYKPKAVNKIMKIRKAMAMKVLKALKTDLQMLQSASNGSNGQQWKQ